jgi:hypothetical protein
MSPRGGATRALSSCGRRRRRRRRRSTHFTLPRVLTERTQRRRRRGEGGRSGERGKARHRATVRVAQRREATRTQPDRCCAAWPRRRSGGATSLHRSPARSSPPPHIRAESDSGRSGGDRVNSAAVKKVWYERPRGGQGEGRSCARRSGRAGANSASYGRGTCNLDY